MTSFDFEEGWSKLEKDEQENIIYCSPRFAMYQQQRAIELKDDNVIQDKINNYIEKGKLI